MATWGASQIALLRGIGEYMMAKGVAILCEATFWGIYLILIIYAMYTQGRQDISSRARYVMLTVSLIMFAMSTTLFALDILEYALVINGALLTIPSEGRTPEDQYRTARTGNGSSDFAGLIIFSLEFLLGDAVVIWRTWAVWQDRRRVIILPMMLWVGSFGTFVGTFVVFARLGIEHGEANLPAFENMLLASWVLSMATNAVATTLIGYKAWIHRQVIKASLGSSLKASRVERILALLVESGFIYLVLWAIQTMNFAHFTYSPALVVSLTAALIGNQTVGLYPTLILVIVNMQRTIWDSPEVSAAVASAIRFANNDETEMSGATSTQVTSDVLFLGPVNTTSVKSISREKVF